MKFVYLIRTAHPAATVLAVMSLGILLIKLLDLNKIPAPLSVVADLGLVAEAVLASIVASYVFYLLVVHLKEATDRALVRPYVVKHSKRVVASCRQQLAAIASASGASLSFESVTQEEINDAFLHLSPYGEAPMFFFPNDQVNWLQYLEHAMHKSRKSIDRVLAQLPLLDAKLIAKILAVDDCEHFEHLGLTGSAISFQNEDLTAWAPSFAQYIVLCRDLNFEIRSVSME